MVVKVPKARIRYMDAKITKTTYANAYKLLGYAALPASNPKVRSSHAVLVASNALQRTSAARGDAPETSAH